MISISKEVNIRKLYADNEARTILIHVSNEDINLILGNVYAPAEGKTENERKMKRAFCVGIVMYPKYSRLSEQLSPLDMTAAGYHFFPFKVFSSFGPDLSSAR